MTKLKKTSHITALTKIQAGCKVIVRVKINVASIARCFVCLAWLIVAAWHYLKTQSGASKTPLHVILRAFNQ